MRRTKIVATIGPASRDPEGRAVAAGHSSAGAEYTFALARFDLGGALDTGFGGGVVLTSFPGTSRSRATAIARQADGKLVVAGIACSSGSGAQCSGGTARLALARYLVAPSLAPPPGGTPPPVTLKKKFVTLPSRLTVHRGVVRVKVRCVQAKRCKGKLSLRRLRKGRSALLLGSKTATVKARRTRTIVVKVRRKRLDRRRKSRVRIEFAGRDATGAPRKITKTVPLKRR